VRLKAIAEDQKLDTSGRSARSPAQWQGSSHRPPVSQSAARE